MVCSIASDTRLFRSNDFQLTDLFQTEIDAVVYTDQFTCYNKKRPSKGWSGVNLLHDNTSSHKCEVVKSFLASEKVKKNPGRISVASVLLGKNIISFFL